MSNGKAHRSVAYRKKLQDEKERKDKEARVSDAKRMASVETEMDRTKSRNLAQKQAVEQDDWSLYKDEFEPYRRRPPSPAPGVKPPAKCGNLQIRHGEDIMRGSLLEENLEAK